MLSVNPHYLLFLYYPAPYYSTPYSAVCYQYTLKTMKVRKVISVLSEGGYQWKERGHKERMKKDKCGRRILYSGMKIE
jgi:hypothetical protein